jgi:hypothetical protein
MPTQHRTARTPYSLRHDERGSTLVLVIILTFGLSIIVASLLHALIGDKRLNRRISLANQARNAAEGVVEAAVAEIDRRAASYSSLGATSLSDYTLPTEVAAFLAYGGIDATSLQFKPGNLSPLPNKPVVIDGTDPFNAPDIDKGKPVVLRHAYVYGRAAATDPVTGQTVTSHVSNLVQIREQTWLNYAVFYNLDLEMHSGSAMDVVGPVHTNQNAYITSGNGVNLRFWGSFTTPKKILRKYKYGGTVTHTGGVYFTPKESASASELLSMSMSQDSNMSGFKTFAENRWKGFLQEQSFEVPEFNPPGLLEYVPDDHTTSSVDEMRNSAYAMIEPQLASVSSDDVSTHTYRGFKGLQVENQKFSALAGLTIRIKDASTWDSIPSANPTDPGFELVYYLGANPNRPVNRSNLPQRDGITQKPIEYVVDPARMSPALLQKLNDAVKIVKYAETGSGTAGNRSLAATDVDPSSGVANRYGLYDRRQGYQGGSSNNGLMGAHHTLQIDMAAFHTFLNAPAAEWEDQIDSSLKVYDPDVSYSGIVYVQLPLVPYSNGAVSARDTTDKIRPAVGPTATTPGYAVVLRNASVLPSLPSDLSRRDDGLTFATNGPVYIMGNYNADGSSSTGSSSAPDTTNPLTNTELPALVAADAVTLLSSVYNDGDMGQSAKSTLNTAAFTEVSTGIISGIVPTNLNTSGVGTNNQWAGGVHNFVRFLENWTNKTYRYRGSVVCLYENEVSKGPWYQSVFTYWYNFPQRDVGYHTYFAGGKFPPGLPVMRTVRRISVADITAAQYASGPPTPPVAAE